MTSPVDALTPARATPGEVVGFRDVDQHVYRIACRQAANDWPRGTAAKEYATAFGISESRVDNWAAEAARLNRLLGVADYLRTKALHVVDRTLEMDHKPELALVAAKLILERVDAKGPGSSGPAQPDRTQALRATLLDPPPELLALLLEWLEGAAGGAEVSEVLERNGWRRG